MLARLLCLIVLLFPAAVLAQAEGEVAKACMPNGAPDPAYERERRTVESAQELPRL